MSSCLTLSPNSARFRVSSSTTHHNGHLVGSVSRYSLTGLFFCARNLRCARRRVEKRKLLRMEFRTLVNMMTRVPCQIVKTGRRIVSSVLAWNKSQPVFW